MSVSPCHTIATRIGELFECTEVNGYVRIRTPFVYPDGDIVDVFLNKDAQSAWQLSDLGETLRWLRMQTAATRRTARQQRLIQDVCMTSGVQLFRGTLATRLDSEDHIHEAVMRLAQACIRVADLWFTFRTRTVANTADEVAEYLTEQQISFERAAKLPGRTGRIWTIDFQTRSKNASSLVQVLATGANAASHGLTEHALAAWYDLRHFQLQSEPVRFVTLFDDTSDVWAPEDFALVSEISHIAYWSKPEDLRDLLAA
ncbi:MAG: DUF1828 domain-containing protein [Maioricimonas sp. JB049]